MYEIFTPAVLQDAIEAIARSAAGVVRPQFVAFLLAALWFYVLARVLRYGFLFADLQLAQRARAVGQTPPTLAFVLGYVGVLLFAGVCAILFLVLLAELWLTVAREIHLGDTAFVEGMGRCALRFSRFFW